MTARVFQMGPIIGALKNGDMRTLPNREVETYLRDAQMNSVIVSDGPFCSGQLVAMGGQPSSALTPIPSDHRLKSHGSI
jgi:hypothetical protein